MSWNDVGTIYTIDTTECKIHQVVNVQHANNLPTPSNTQQAEQTE